MSERDHGDRDSKSDHERDRWGDVVLGRTLDQLLLLRRELGQIQLSLEDLSKSSAETSQLISDHIEDEEKWKSGHVSQIARLENQVGKMSKNLDTFINWIMPDIKAKEEAKTAWKYLNAKVPFWAKILGIIVGIPAFLFSVLNYILDHGGPIKKILDILR